MNEMKGKIKLFFLKQISWFCSILNGCADLLWELNQETINSKRSIRYTQIIFSYSALKSHYRSKGAWIVLSHEI